MRGMPIATDLPDDIDALKHLVVARTVERDAFKVERDAAVAERDAAKAGLVNKRWKPRSSSSSSRV